MDFFEYASVASGFTNVLWVQLLIGGLCFALVFVFEGVALFTIASREGYKNKWMAFIPFFNTYYIGVCAQKNRFYNIDTKKIGIIAAVLEFVLFALYIVYNVACVILIKGGYETYTIRETVYGSVKEYYLNPVPENLEWAAWMYNYMKKYILNIAEIIYLLLQVSLLICFFQTYACRRYVLFAITSILFPIQGILFFVVRNNKGVNYREFVRAEQARQYAAYQQQQQQFYNQNPYNNRTNYERNPYNGTQDSTNENINANRGNPPEDPFGDLGVSDSSPFDDFDK